MIQLKDICDIYDCPHTTAKDEGKGYPLVRTPNVGKGRLILDGIHRVSEDVYNSRNARAIPEEGDLILAREAPVGNVSIIMDGQRVCLGQRVVLIKPKRELVDPHFLTYYLLSAEVQHRLKNHANGAVVAHLNVSDIRNLWVTLPELEEQVAIGKILRSIDDKIELNRQINDNLEQQASNLFQDWLNNCENSIMLRELTDNVLDYTPNTHEHVYLLNSSDVTEGQFTVLPLTPNINLKGQFKKRFKKGDILYSEIRPRNRHYAYCYFDADKYIASTRLIVLRAKPEKLTSSILLYQYLMLNNVFEEFTLKTESRSGTFPQGNYEDLSSIKVPYGASQEQIAKALESIYKQLWTNLEENERLEALRDSLLPKLISGELKINEIDC